ncbi:MAG: bifunctional DNA-formamidopyrimidine glycosylase/DNA-(apurinic or apyrimidinic site) lyase [Alphaproteobacteria bacterium]|nr:bifunctional DNA-formamidopyrimidine glycosylase/DNA-(apurinic or apyrimidinic site) lyase [Alphaproteobacteria bacterium]
MPELPEVETVCRGLRPLLVGRRIAACELGRHGLRIPFPKGLARDLAGCRIEAVERRAKYILMRLDSGRTLIAHLGMSGRMTVAAPPLPARGKHDHFRLVLDDGRGVTLNDPRRFGLVALAASAELNRHALFRHLGPDPLTPEFTPRLLAARLAGRRTAVKLALLDQRIVVGVGNIYASEALFRAGISPKRAAGRCLGDRAAALAAAIRQVLRDAIAAGGSSLRDYVQADGELGYFQHRFAVYDRAGQPCPGCDCGGAVKRLVQGGRSTFYCPARQR